ncbi:MAG: arsenite methyltransferase [Chloroflexi bacterium]|nr:arsenite methyltransferase [Chloroflexota bacterium]
MKKQDKLIKTFVRIQYAALAQRAGSCCAPEATSARPEGAASVEQLYGKEKLASLPEGATAIAAGCGDPTALAELKPGEVVLDLGSGGGIDCLLAAERVGPRGRVIGIDLTPEMVEVARQNAAAVEAKNVEFHLGEIESLPLEEASVDVIISNCVINLSPDKDAVFQEAFRVLRPGGRLAVADIVALGKLPTTVRGSMASWAACVAGALEKEEYLGKIQAAGFEVTGITETPVNLKGIRVASAKIKATKPF